MIASRTVVVMLVCVDPVGGGAVKVIGISPAKAETERTHVNAIAITKRFIWTFSFEFEGMQKLGLRTE